MQAGDEEGQQGDEERFRKLAARLLTFDWRIRFQARTLTKLLLRKYSTGTRDAVSSVSELVFEKQVTCGRAEAKRRAI